MKNLTFILLVLISTLLISGSTFALEADQHDLTDVYCPCGFDADHSCIPCKGAESEGIPNQPESITTCPCDVDAGGNCLPCKDSPGDVQAPEDQ